MERNYGKEIDSIQAQLDEIKGILSELTQHTRENGPREGKTPGGKNNHSLRERTAKMGQRAMPHRSKWESKRPLRHIEPMRNMHADNRLSTLHEELCEKADRNESTGCITHLGVFASGGRQSNWVKHEVNTDALLALIESNAAAKVLACIGSNERLNLLLALLREPRSAANLVEDCGYNTTGQVYHHLRPLLAADLVVEDAHARGKYCVQPHRVSGIIMLLAGISDMLDTKYSQGKWDADNNLPEPDKNTLVTS